MKKLALTNPSLKLFLLLVLLIPFLAGCGGTQKAEARVDVNDLLKKGVRPNEMGMVMLLEYHRITQTEGSFQRSVENFKKDLETLYSKGYRLVSFSDMLSGHISVPAGMTPVVLTFDDSSLSQFKYDKQGAQLVIDPNSALGLMDAFHKKHPDFGYTALFNYLPELFDQPDYVTQKVTYLYKNGFQLGDHTVSHSSLAKLTDEQVQKEIAVPVTNMKQINPKVSVDILCLPFGIEPKNLELMYSGTYGGTTYKMNWSLLVGSNPMYMQYHYKNPGKLLPRVQAMDYNAKNGVGADGSYYWLDYFDRHPETRYISDGDPNSICAPAYMESRLLQDRLPKNATFVGY
jgi:peptidoglycan/xylan/chitin deacetylase (PgdA/CDA1 family)